MQGGFVHVGSTAAEPRVRAHDPFVFHARETKSIGAAMLAAGVAMNAVDFHGPATCPLLVTTGIPCPLCGMTTGVRATLRGDIAAATTATPAAIALVLGLVVLLATNRKRPLVVPRPALFGTLALMWIFQLFRFGVL